MEGKEKPGVFVYHSLREPMQELNMEQRGELFTAIIDYSADGTDPAFGDPLLRMAWAIVRRDIDRDSDKYEATVKRRKYAAYCKIEKDAGRRPVSFDEWDAMQSSAGKCMPDQNDNSSKTAKSAHDSTCKQVDANETKKKRVRSSASKRNPTTTPTTTPTSTPTTTPTTTSNNTEYSNNHSDDMNSVDDMRNVPKKSSGFVRPTREEVRQYCQERNSGVNPDTFWDYYQARDWKAGRLELKDWKAQVRYWESNGLGKANSSQGSSRGVPGSFWDMDKRPGNYFAETAQSMSVDEFNSRSQPPKYDDFNMEQELNSIFSGGGKNAAH